MIPAEFDDLLNRRIDLIKSSLQLKGGEYSTQDDKLHNFVSVAKMRSLRGQQYSETEAAQGMLDKHLISFFDILSGIQKGKKYKRDYIDEKIGDIINYFILQEAIIVQNHLLND